MGRWVEFLEGVPPGRAWSRSAGTHRRSAISESFESARPETTPYQKSLFQISHHLLQNSGSWVEITATMRMFMRASRPLLITGFVWVVVINVLAKDTGNNFTPDPNPKELIRAAMDQWRGMNSYSEMTMTIHRPNWERAMSIRAWTEGDKKSLVRVTAPKKDFGNGSLLDDRNMWTFSPKINRIIKVPSSMMSQSWMGSDFSNKDLSKSTDIITQYDHRLIETRAKYAHIEYVIEAVPHDYAAVVWGKEVLIIRDDYILLEEEYWDQEGILVKK